MISVHLTTSGRTFYKQGHILGFWGLELEHINSEGHDSTRTPPLPEYILKNCWNVYWNIGRSRSCGGGGVPLFPFLTFNSHLFNLRDPSSHVCSSLHCGGHSQGKRGRVTTGTVTLGTPITMCWAGSQQGPWHPPPHASHSIFAAWNWETWGKLPNFLALIFSSE